jgi:hypothetical protein
MAQTIEELLKLNREREQNLTKLKKERQERELRLCGRGDADGCDAAEAAAAAAAADAGAKEKVGEEYYLIPKEGCRECGKRLPLKLMKPKHKNEENASTKTRKRVRNKVELICANQKCRGGRDAPRSKGWDVWEGGEEGGGSDHNENAPKRLKHEEIVVDSNDDLPLKDRKAKLLSCDEVLSVERNRQDGLNVLAEVSMDVHVSMPTEGRKRGPLPEASLDSRKVFQPLTYFADSKYFVDSLRQF